MADKLNDLAGRMGKAPKGLGKGGMVLAAGAAAIYGLQQSMYTVDGGHRAIMFNRSDISSCRHHAIPCIIIAASSPCAGSAVSRTTP